jgi:hypothetical protein
MRARWRRMPVSRSRKSPYAIESFMMICAGLSGLRSDICPCGYCHEREATLSATSGPHVRPLALPDPLFGGEVALTLPYTIPMHQRPCCAGRATCSRSRTNQAESGSLSSDQPNGWRSWCLVGRTLTSTWRWAKASLDQPSQPTPSPLPSKPCGSGGKTVKLSTPMSSQTRFGGTGGMQKSG